MEPRLGKPGAGLPLLELLLARYWFLPRGTRRSTWEGNARQFQEETRKILTLVDGLSAEQLSRKILLPRLQGMEDSSRYWSVAMTLEHLVIVGNAMKEAILKLSHGEKLKGKISTADVKPKGSDEAPASLEAFRTLGERLIQDIEVGVGAKDSPARFAHPWFGPLTAAQWMWVMALHQAVHRRQIREIIKRL